MGLSIAGIKNLLVNEYTAATDEVKNFVAWVEGKDAQIAQAHTEFEATISRQQELGSILSKAGYSVNAGSINPPAA